MNFQLGPALPPLKVLVVNPLSPSAKLTIVKILSGAVFGSYQLIDLILLVYSNEIPSAEENRMELRNCGFACMNSIEVSSNLPCLSDADVFCFMTNFSNPNYLDFTNIDNDMFDALYLIIKIANNLIKTMPSSELAEKEDTIRKSVSKNKNSKDEPKSIKPIIFADGLVALDILKSLSHNMPDDVFFCCTPLPPIAKIVMGEYLKVQCNVINDVLVWAANDEVFHVEVEKPLIIHDRVGDGSRCEWDMVGKDLLQSFNLDHTQFNDSWLKKEYIEKILATSIKNPYGCIYKAAEFAKSLRTIWQARTDVDGTKVYCCLGVISDGSLGTVKGHPYVLPLVFAGDEWTVNKRFAETAHLQQEIKRINKTAKDQHQKLIQYCKKFLEENVIKQDFIPGDSRSGSAYSLSGRSSQATVQ